MSRALLRAVLAALFLAASAPAAPGPGELFDAVSPDGARRARMVLQLDGRRYTVRDGRLHDARAPDPGRPFLTNAQVLELIGPLPAISIPLPAIEFKPPPPPDPLSTLIPRRDPAVNFDGGLARREGTWDIPLPSSSDGPLADPAVLQARFLSVLRFRGNAAERAALGEAAENVLKTRTGRELARQFVLEGATAEVGLAPIADSTTTVRDGVRVVSGTRGFATTTGSTPGVTISRAYLEADPEWRRVNMAGTFGHELFGHLFEHQRAAKAGVPRPAFYHYQGDEIGSRLIAWSIKTELGGLAADAEMDEYLADPQAYIRGLLAVDEYYAVTLNPVEMRNPADTLKARRPDMETVLESRRAQLADLRLWAPIIAHFKSVHGVAPERLSGAERQAKEYVDDAARRVRELESILKTIDERLAYWKTPAGAKEKAELVHAAGSDYFRRFESRMRDRVLALERQREELAARERGPDSAMMMPGLVIRGRRDDEASAEPIGLDELREMYREDLTDNPKHWETTK